MAILEKRKLKFKLFVTEPRETRWSQVRTDILPSHLWNKCQCSEKEGKKSWNGWWGPLSEEQKEKYFKQLKEEDERGGSGEEGRGGQAGSNGRGDSCLPEEQADAAEHERQQAKMLQKQMKGFAGDAAKKKRKKKKNRGRGRGRKKKK